MQSLESIIGTNNGSKQVIYKKDQGANTEAMFTRKESTERGRKASILRSRHLLYM